METACQVFFLCSLSISDRWCAGIGVQPSRGGLFVALAQPLVATLGVAVLALGAASAPSVCQGPWRDRPCRTAFTAVERLVLRQFALE